MSGVRGGRITGKTHGIFRRLDAHLRATSGKVEPLEVFQTETVQCRGSVSDGAGGGGEGRPRPGMVVHSRVAQQAVAATLAGEVTFSEPAGQWGGSRDGAAPWD